MIRTASRILVRGPFIVAALPGSAAVPVGISAKLTGIGVGLRIEGASTGLIRKGIGT